MKVTLRARDSDNQQLRQGGLKVTVDLNYIEADRVEPLRHPVPVTVVDHQNGTYGISFKLDESGILLMNIRVDGDLVKVSKSTSRKILAFDNGKRF